MLSDEEKRARNNIAAKKYRTKIRGGPPNYDLIPCGSRAAAARHKGRGEPLCGLCDEANRRYQREAMRAYRAGKKKR